MGILTKNSSEKSNAPHIPGVSPLGLNINRCIMFTTLIIIHIQNGRCYMHAHVQFVLSKVVLLNGNDFHSPNRVRKVYLFELSLRTVPTIVTRIRSAHLETLGFPMGGTC